MKKILIFLLICLGGNSLKSQSYDTNIEAFVDSLIHSDLKNDQPGVAVGIIRNGETIFMKGYGMSSLEYDLPVDTYTKFNLASCSKQFTAACVLMLEKEGKILLDEDIHVYLPELPDYGHKITIRNLLHHTSGIPPTDVLQLFKGDLYEVRWDMKDEYSMICKYGRLNFDPNDEYLYSNSGYVLMSMIVEKCTGMSLEKYLRKAVLEPLGMRHTEVYDEYGEIIKNRSTGYAKKGEQYIERFPLQSSVTGSTNVYTCVEDMMLWDKALLKEGFFGREMLNRFYEPVDTFNNGDTIKYTCGFNVWKYKGARIVEHSGFDDGYVCRNHVIPERNFAVVALGNCENEDVWKITMGIADKLLELKEEPPKGHTETIIDKSSYTSYAGTYQLADGMRITTEISNDTLWLLIPGAPRFRLVAESSTCFFLNEFDAQCSFAGIENGKAQKMTWRQGGTDYPGTRVEAAGELTENEKQAYAGNYRNEFLSITYPVIIKDQILTVLLPESFPEYVGIDRELPLVHLSGDLFLASKVGPVQFQRNEKKMITGLTFKDVGRVRNIEFVKE